jgi:hypothetical protein
MGLQRPAAIGFTVDDSAVVADYQDRAGDAGVRDGLLNDCIDARKVEDHSWSFDILFNACETVDSKDGDGDGQNPHLSQKMREMGHPARI